MSETKVRFPNESDEYREQRSALLRAESDLRDQIEAVAAQRRAMPLGGEVPEDYAFDRLDSDGRVEQVHLSKLFGEGQNSLAVYNFMYGPDMEVPCPSCSSILDSFEGNVRHILPRLNIVFVAKSPIERIHAWANLRGWKSLQLLSSADSTYNRDYHGENEKWGQMPMLNVFVRRDDKVHHFWGSELLYARSAFEPRHVDLMWPIWNVFDLTPEGRGGDGHPKRNYYG